MSRIDEWNDESFLSKHGYSADGSISELRRHIILDQLIESNDHHIQLQILSHLKWLLDDRGHRMPKAKRIWLEDIQYVSQLINSRSQGVLGHDVYEANNKENNLSIKSTSDTYSIRTNLSHVEKNGHRKRLSSKNTPLSFSFAGSKKEKTLLDIVHEEKKKKIADKNRHSRFLNQHKKKHNNPIKGLENL